MSYSPNLPSGQAVSAQSAPVVVAEDDVLSTDIDSANQLDEIRTAVTALAGAKGILADLRVTPTGNVTVVIGSGTVTTVTTLTTLSQIGGIAANGVVQDLENNTYTNAFSVNMTRP